jgi:hypothetical protein
MNAQKEPLNLMPFGPDSKIDGVYFYSLWSPATRGMESVPNGTKLSDSCVNLAAIKTAIFVQKIPVTPEALLVRSGAAQPSEVGDLGHLVP